MWPFSVRVACDGIIVNLPKRDYKESRGRRLRRFLLFAAYLAYTWVMSDMVSMPVNDIPEPERRSLENLLGHPLTTDQQVFVMVFSTGKLADEATRREAVQRIRSTLDNIDRYRVAHEVSDNEVDAAVDEAMGHVRPRPD
jgi:hypothetical protein